MIGLNSERIKKDNWQHNLIGLALVEQVHTICHSNVPEGTGKPSLEGGVRGRVQWRQVTSIRTGGAQGRGGSDQRGWEWWQRLQYPIPPGPDFWTRACLDLHHWLLAQVQVAVLILGEGEWISSYHEVTSRNLSFNARFRGTHFDASGIGIMKLNLSPSQQHLAAFKKTERSMTEGCMICG